MSSTAGTRTGRGPSPPAGVNYLELWFALMGGAAAWLLRLIVNASLVEYSCSISATWPVWATTGIATAIAAAALLVSLRYRRMSGDANRETARWLALLALMFNVLALIGIVFETLPVLFLDICMSVNLPA